ncbi:MAG: PIN domain-containing protein [Beijerinckiaceae bacterium]
MIYVFDTSAFITLKNFYPSAFRSLWAGMEKLIDAGELISVREVFNELGNYNDADFIQQWAKDHRAIFATPVQDELLLVQQVLAVPHFQSLIGSKALLKGTPVADPFVIASAMVRKGNGTRSYARTTKAKRRKDSKCLRAFQGTMHESGILHGSSEMGVLTVTERGASDESDFDFDERLMTDLVRGIRRVYRPWTSRRLPVVASVLTSRQFTLRWGGTMALGALFERVIRRASSSGA